MVKALCLFSGGLDSILTVKLLQEQQIEVKGLTFVSYFFNAQIAREVAQQINLPLRIIDISGEHLAMVKNPLYGYGKNMNPCLDCHLMMLVKAREIMIKEGFDVVVTGEVLGERPFSQNLSALKLLEKKSGLTGYLLRPLSAKLLPPTISEQKGLVDREKLLDISGRSRKKQLALVKKFGLLDYPTPAGGCLLTDPEFSKRLKEMLTKWPKAAGQDIELLKHGRIFWQNDVFLIIGRNQEENTILVDLAAKGDALVEPKNIAGPSVLIRSRRNWSGQRSLIIKKAQELVKKYSKKTSFKKTEFEVKVF